MKPTRNQLLLGCQLDEESCTVPRLMLHIGQYRYADSAYVFLTSFTEWNVSVRIKSRESSSMTEREWNSVQIPIEPLEGIGKIKAWAWLCNEAHPCTLSAWPGEDNLLVQATNAGVKIDKYLPVEVEDKEANTLPPTKVLRTKQGMPYDFQPKPTKTIHVLDKGSVLLGFELAGIPAPKDYDTWRKPDGIDVPERCTMRYATQYGTSTVHYTNGETALITTGDGKRAELVKVKHMDNAAVKELSDLKKSLRPKSDKVKEEKITDESIKALAAKWFTEFKK